MKFNGYVIHSKMGVSEVLRLDYIFMLGETENFVVIRPLKDNKEYYSKPEFLRQIREAV